jgi:predicted nucleic acid-binding protein
LHGESGAVQLVYSDTVTNEVERNLSKKVPPALAHFHTVQASGTLEYTEPPQALVDECGDLVQLKDAAIIAAAIHSDCEWIATFDEKHLLSARAAILPRYNITTARPDEILETLGLIRSP